MDLATVEQVFSYFSSGEWNEVKLILLGGVFIWLIFTFWKKFIFVENNPNLKRNSLWVPIIVCSIPSLVILGMYLAIDDKKENDKNLMAENKHEEVSEEVANEEIINEEVEIETEYPYAIKVFTLPELVKDPETEELVGNEMIDFRELELKTYLNNNGMNSSFVRTGEYGLDNNGIKQIAFYVNDKEDKGDITKILNKMKSIREFYDQAGEDLKWGGKFEKYHGVTIDITDSDTNRMAAIDVNDIPYLEEFLHDNKDYTFDELYDLLAMQ